MRKSTQVVSEECIGMSGTQVPQVNPVDTNWDIRVYIYYANSDISHVATVVFVSDAAVADVTCDI